MTNERKDRSDEAPADEAPRETADGGAPADAAVNAFRTVGAALGGWARRIGTKISEAASAAAPNEELRGALVEVRDLRQRGHFTGARERLRVLQQEHPQDPQVVLALGLTLVAETIADQRPPAALEELVSALATNQRLRQRGALQHLAPLLEGALQLARHTPEKALDDLRRAQRGLDELPASSRVEARFYAHFLATLAQAARGRNERAVLELHKARASLPEGTPPALQRRLLLDGVAVLLAEDQLDEALAWLVPLAGRPAPEPAAEPAAAEPAAPAPPADEAPPPPDPLVDLARALLARVHAAKGDADAAEAVLQTLPDEPAWDAFRIRVGLCRGPSTPNLTRALRHLQVAPEEWQRGRLWALAEVAAWSVRSAPPVDGSIAAVVDALVKAADAAPAGQQAGFVQELAHVLLRADRFPETALAVVLRRLAKDADNAAEELRLVRARQRLRAGENAAAAEDFLTTQPLRFRAQPDLGGPAGPDEVSPLRDPVIRLRTLRSQRALAAAEFCARGELWDEAQEHLVEALAEAPDLQPARVLLGKIVRPTRSARLEDLLTAATTVLAGVPSHVLGVPVAGAQEALGGVIAARERLARPLTIAVMGEFSSGKSTFVNALLGEPIAPMGVLPTTTTINLFRRGPTGGARIYYRDDRIATLSRQDIHDFLHGLDDVEASRIRHVEIERTGPRMGDAAVVDTPGLNALDAFHERVAREFIDEADAVIWVFSATRGSTASEAGMLAGLRADGRQVLGVLNKVDTLDPDEQRELADYLREQLGEVLVDIVPACSTKALAVRSGEALAGEGDPFAAIEEALEGHFLRRARELKRTLTARRLRDALRKAHAAVASAATALEAAADGAAGSDHLDTLRSQQRLVAFADRQSGAVLDLDDLLVRECLALGLLRSGAGLTRDTFSAQDAWYLGTVVHDGMLRALQAALGELSREGDFEILYEVLTAHLVPWARGYLDGLAASGFVIKLLVDHGAAITRGEAALRERLRHALAPMAAAWQKFILSLDRPLRQAQVQAHRQAATRPRAEALRLRTTALVGIESLLASVDELHP